MFFVSRKDAKTRFFSECSSISIVGLASLNIYFFNIKIKTLRLFSLRNLKFLTAEIAKVYAKVAKTRFFLSAHVFQLWGLASLVIIFLTLRNLDASLGVH